MKTPSCLIHGSPIIVQLYQYAAAIDAESPQNAEHSAAGEDLQQKARFCRPKNKKRSDEKHLTALFMGSKLNSDGVPGGFGFAVIEDAIWRLGIGAAPVC